MPKKQVSDLITDQEMAFARLILAGTHTDRDAAQAAGLNPDTAAYTKAKPRVREYMLEHRAAVEQQLVAQEAERQRQLNLLREQLRGRLLDLANMSPALTRGSITGQIKAISLIMAMEGLIPDRRARSAEKTSTPASGMPQIYQSAWLAKQQEKAVHPEPSPAPVQEQEEPGLDEPEPAPAPAQDAPPMMPSVPYVPPLASAPDTRVPFSIKKRRWGR